MKLKHKTRMYPPHVKMTVIIRPTNGEPDVILPIRVVGCSPHGRLDMDLVFSDGRHSNVQVGETC